MRLLWHHLSQTVQWHWWYHLWEAKVMSPVHGSRAIVLTFSSIRVCDYLSSYPGVWLNMGVHAVEFSPTRPFHSIEKMEKNWGRGFDLWTKLHALIHCFQLLEPSMRGHAHVCFSVWLLFVKPISNVWHQKLGSPLVPPALSSHFLKLFS